MYHSYKKFNINNWCQIPIKFKLKINKLGLIKNEKKKKKEINSKLYFYSL